MPKRIARVGGNKELSTLPERQDELAKMTNHRLVTEHVAELREVLLNTLDPVEIQAIVRELYRIAMGQDKFATTKERIRCIEIILDRYFGKAITPIAMESKTVKTVTHDLGNLSNDELKTIEGILSKHEQVVDIEVLTEDQSERLV